jgi:hypothetical protein
MEEIKSCCSLVMQMCFVIEEQICLSFEHLFQCTLGDDVVVAAEPVPRIVEYIARAYPRQLTSRRVVVARSTCNDRCPCRPRARPPHTVNTCNTPI